MHDAAEIYARAMPLFQFSRGQSVSDFKIRRDLIHNALSSASCFGNYDEIDVLADKWQHEFSAREEVERRGNRSLGF